jgi:NAD(P)-dependent dehydrogenase (short-subunit alcohol dehydrogenase family)
MNARSASAPFPERSVIVTGGSSGIGLETARRFHAAGANVWIFDINPPPESTDSAITYIKCDIGDEKAIRAAVAQSIGDRPLHTLINAAGIIRRAKTEEASLADWELMLKVNLTGMFQLCAVLFNNLKVSSDAAIVNIASIAALVPQTGAIAYGPSKAAVISLTKQLAVEWGQYGIRVNAICPGMIRTAMTEPFYNPETINIRNRKTALGRVGMPEDIAKVALFLAGDGASYITGEAIVVDGGFTATGLHLLLQ